MERRDGQGGPRAPKSQESTSPKEQAKPQGEGAANPPTKKIEKVSLFNPGSTVFDCAVPKIVPSPEGIWRIFSDSPNTQEVQEMRKKMEQEWLEHIKAMDKGGLENELSWAEGQRKGLLEGRKPMSLEYVQKLEWQLEVIREHLRQLGGD